MSDNDFIPDRQQRSGMGRSEQNARLHERVAYLKLVDASAHVCDKGAS